MGLGDFGPGQWNEDLGAPTWQAQAGGSTSKGSGYNIGQLFSQVGAGLATNAAAGAYTPAPQTNAAGLTQFLDTLYGPQNILINDQIAALQSQLGQVGINDAKLTGNAQAQNALDLQALGLTREGIGLDKQYTRDMLANTLAGFNVDERGAKQSARYQGEDLRSDLTSRGAFLTGALDRGQGRIDTGLANTLDKIGLGRQGAELSAEHRLAGLDIAMRKTNLDEKALGLALDNTLTQLGIQNQIQANDIYGALTGARGEQAQLYAQMMIQYAQLMAAGVDLSALLPPSKAQSTGGQTVPGSRMPL